MADASFEMNQSFPVFGNGKKGKRLLSSLKKFAKFTGEEHDSFCYSGNSFENSILDMERSGLDERDSAKSRNGSRPVSSLSFSASWSSFPEMSSVTDDHSNFISRASNKAVITVDAKSLQVLTANKQACILFDHTSESICQMKLPSMFKKSYKNAEQKKALMTAVEDAEGNLTVTSGNVREIITKHGRVVPVSVWMRRYDSKDGRKLCMVILESVSRITGNFNFNTQGDILFCDDDFAHIHGFPTAASLEEINLKKLMPGYEIPQFGCRLTKALRKQYTTSTAVDGTKFPISIYLQSQEKDDILGKFFAATVWFFTNISGPLTTNSSGIIQNINCNFSLSLLGYTAAELKDKNVATLLPDLSEDRNDKLTDAQDCSEAGLAPLPDSSEERIVNPLQTSASDSRSSFVNISLPILPDGSKSSHSSPTNAALDKINSLLLGKSPLIRPGTPPGKEPLRRAEDSYGCAFGQRTVDDSWVEVSLNPGSKPARTAELESESLRKINLLLNGSADELPENDRSESAFQSISSDAQLNSNETGSSSADNRSVGSPPVRNGGLRFIRDEKENAADSNSASDSENLFSNSKKFAGNRRNLPQSINVTSTPLGESKRRPKVKCLLREGAFEGQALHKDGAYIGVTYEICQIPQCNLYCIWLSLGSDKMRLDSSLSSNQTLYSSFNSTLPSLNASFVSGICDQSLGSAIKQAAQRLNESSESVFSPLEGTDEWLAIQGKFGEKYDIRRAVGNGAFGFVRNAKLKKTNRKFVVKFIRKEKVLEECWVEDYEFDSMIPLEIALLAKFDHPNIVKVVDFFENENFFAMVMPTHGVNGIDLFEFIDREPILNELIASHIFRQIASAVFFLHQEGVVHRDIKDENVIIDENFTCKLIDFGSAAFFKPGKTFATFCGTVEYCSPEVLMGERYEGPELEVWALGVTLYTLVYGENPFSDIEETVAAEMRPPHFLSPELMSLIRYMLQPVPEHRYTIRDVVHHEWVNIPVDISVYSWDEVVPPAKRKQSFVDVSFQSKFHLRPEDESSNGDSLLSSRETLADHIRKWNKRVVDEPAAKDIYSPPKESLLPLTKRLENINLNHSI